MIRVVETAGERVLAETELGWVGELVAESLAGSDPGAARDASVRVVVERSPQPFPLARPRLVARGATADGGVVVLENACSSGFDLRLDAGDDVPEFRLRWRPPRRERVAARLLRARFQLLARALLVQYPALWQAARRGRVPLHASGLVAGGSSVLVVGAGGVGRSTLLLREVEAGAATTGDNVGAGDGETVWGLVEPWRVDGGSGAGRRTTHGRRELAAPNRLASVVPTCLVVLSRRPGGEQRLEPCPPIEAARALVTATYMAGELRRFWPFVATLAAATGVGPAHPPVADVAAGFAGRLPCFTLELGAPDGPLLSNLLPDREGAAAWAC